MKKIKFIFLSLVLALSLTACSNGEQKQDVEKQSFTAGTYVADTFGNNGKVEVEVTFSETEITNVVVTKQEETAFLAELPLEILPQQIVEHQSLSVDAISGATITSYAILTAVKDTVEQAGGNVDLLKANVPEKPKATTVDLTSDVVVIGGGSSGLAAALTSDQNDLSVIVLEKNATLGGHTSLSGGYSLVTGSKIQKDLGVTNDTVQAAFDDIMANGGNNSVPEILNVYVNNMAAATDWTFDYCNAGAPKELQPLAENKIDRAIIYEGSGLGLMQAMEKTLEKTDIQLYKNTRANKLIVEDGKVVGVEAFDKTTNTTYIIKANDVILSTGSHAARNDLLPDSLSDFIYYGAGLASGDGIDMATEIGAATADMGFVELFENGVEWKPGIAKSTYNGSMNAWNVSGILVDLEGNRVVNERGAGPDIIEQQAKQENAALYLLMDQATYDTFRENIGGYGISFEMLDQWLEANGSVEPIFAHADTVKDVAEIIGMNGANLEATIQRYNSFVRNGVDEDFGRDAKYMAAEIGEGPYYLVEQKPRFATTLGGLVVNGKLQVLDTDNNVIEGLYATGDVAGGARGNNSIAGSDVGWAIISGYTIGDTLVNE